MGVRISGSAVGELRTLFQVGSMVGLSDAELIDRYLDHGRPGSAIAFEVLIERHGPMVLRVCRSILNDDHEARDAFQEVFLVLARRAGRIRRRGSLGPWLHGVAARTASKSRGRRIRRHRAEAQRIDRDASSAAGVYSADTRSIDTWPELHEEVARLPSKYRAPVVLCYFEGRTHDEAAALLRWPVGTIRGRLARARDLLRDRLTRRGLAPAIAALASPGIARSAALPGLAISAGTPPIPPSLIRATLASVASGPTSPAVPVGLISAIVSSWGGVSHMIVFSSIVSTGLVAMALLTLTRSPGTFPPDLPDGVEPPPSLTGSPHLAPSLIAEDRPGPEPRAEPTDDILDRWERRCRDAESLLIECEIVSESPMTGERIASRGIVFSDFGGLAAQRFTSADNGKNGWESRLVWQEGVTYDFDPVNRRVLIVPAATPGAGLNWTRLLDSIARFALHRPWDQQPSPLRLAFRFDREEATRHFRIAMMPDIKGHARVAIYPRTPQGKDAFAAVVILLDKMTGWPAEVHSLRPNGKDKEHLLILSIEPDSPPPPDLIDVSTPEGWSITQSGDFLRLPAPR